MNAHWLGLQTGSDSSWALANGCGLCRAYRGSRRGSCQLPLPFFSERPALPKHQFSDSDTRFLRAISTVRFPFPLFIYTMLVFSMGPWKVRRFPSGAVHNQEPQPGGQAGGLHLCEAANELQAFRRGRLDHSGSLAF